ncbi:hypothetical protein FVE85_8798 [Porphyridium purpureum]|uniref:Uncharacterized protein n=1 Tax=Porphyridium purpureum TaxID=35688 RepID=A0A5J4YRD9_PORPP|nr:hypothetical protein FVE85_8798 [Porphyridium purpureum]|eukprot:POR6610..scf296_7
MQKASARWMAEVEEDGLVSYGHFPTRSNVADILTKTASIDVFQGHLRNIIVVCPKFEASAADLQRNTADRMAPSCASENKSADDGIEASTPDEIKFKSRQHHEN